MSEKRFDPYDHEQMFIEVKVAYRLSELGGLLEPDSYDSSELSEIDAEYDQWLRRVKADAWESGFAAWVAYGMRIKTEYPKVPRPPNNPHEGGE